MRVLGNPGWSFSYFVADLKPFVMEEINALLEELNGLYQNIANHALDHIHSKLVRTRFLATTDPLL